MIEHDDATWLGGLCWELDAFKQALHPRDAAVRMRAIAGRVRHDGRIREDQAARTADMLELYADQIAHTSTIGHFEETPSGVMVAVSSHNILAIAAGLLQVSRDEPRSRHRLIVPPR